MTTIKFLSFTKNLFAPLLVISILFVAHSSFWALDTVRSLEKKRIIEVGFPLGFVFVDYSQYGNEDSFVSTEELGMKWGFPSSIIWHLFLLDIIIVQLVLSVLFFLVHLIFPKTQDFTMFLLAVLILFVVWVFWRYGSPPPSQRDPVSANLGMYYPSQSPSPLETTPKTFEQVLAETPEKKISVEASFVRGISLSETIRATQNASFKVLGFKHRSGESNGGCGVGNGETVEQALQSCFRDHTLFLGRRIEMEKQTLLTVTDPGLRNALTESIREAEKKQELRITGMGLYGRALDLQNFKDANSFVGTMVLSNAIEQPSMMPPSGSGAPISLPMNMSIPIPSPAGR